jgi:hypothetical protein
MAGFLGKQARPPAKRDNARLHLEKHLGGSCRSAQTITHAIQPIERVNIQIVLDRWLEAGKPKANVFGYAFGLFPGSANNLSGLVINDISIAPVQRQRFGDVANSLDCVTHGIYLLIFQEAPIAVMLHRNEIGLDKGLTLEVMAQERKTAQAALSELLAEATKESVYKGKSISLEKETDWAREITIRYHELPPTPRDAIILPEAVMKVIEGNVLGMRKHGEALRRAGRSTRFGVLFHGKPGTGKTLAARYLAHACPDYTVILLTGRQLGLIRESCSVARLLAPSLVILEDIDLVAQERSKNRCPTILHELMDEMDGIGTGIDCTFLLTTNRPDVLEPALAARPGRIDQAIEFPLPDGECRQRLFDLYGRGLDLSWIDLDRWIEQTDGVSPAFIKELLRRATLVAVERGEAAQPMRLQNKDVDQALKELVHFGGDLTKRLLGFKT